MSVAVDLLGVRIDNLSRGVLLRELMRRLGESGRANAYYVNVHTLVTARSNPDLKETLQQGDLVWCDGVGIKWGARVLGQRLVARMTPPDWIDDLLAEMAVAGLTVFLLGDEAGLAARAASVLMARHPQLRVVGTHHGFFDHFGPENEAVVAKINASGADLLLVGLGTPLQELWMARYRDRLQTRVNIAVGALYRHVAGVAWRPPRWATDHGLEWLFRLAGSPRRHFRRYVIENAHYGGLLLRELGCRWLPGGSTRL